MLSLPPRSRGPHIPTGFAPAARVRRDLRAILALAVGLPLACGPAPARRAGDTAGLPLGQAGLHTYEVVATYPHDPRAFTQGLVWHRGFLYEGTGRTGESSLRKVDLESGEVLQRVDLAPHLFGEGVTVLDGRVYQLTWLSGVGFVRDLESFELLDEFSIETEGWGLTNDGARLVLSDGSPTLYFLDPASFEVVRTVEVRDANGPVRRVNELEHIGGEIWANVWQSDEILRISPQSGEVLGRIDMRGLIDPGLLRDPDAVLNGIAWDPDGGRLFVTGKLWPRLFEVRIVPAPEARR